MVDVISECGIESISVAMKGYLNACLKLVISVMSAVKNEMRS
jgi:hypothetical protein